jgi:hypothetical protein
VTPGDLLWRRRRAGLIDAPSRSGFEAAAGSEPGLPGDDATSLAAASDYPKPGWMGAAVSSRLGDVPSRILGRMVTTHG